MSVDELLKAVEDLSEPDLDSLVNRALFIRASRRAPVSPPEETSLLREINRPIPSELHDRYAVLADKRDDETLTDAEYSELLDIGDRIECFGVKRLEAMAQLADMRRIPLLKLMDDLGLQSPDIRQEN
jgi:hypothetical protein